MAAEIVRKGSEGLGCVGLLTGILILDIIFYTPVVVGLWIIADTIRPAIFGTIELLK
jgi:hypothetical protein